METKGIYSKFLRFYDLFINGVNISYYTAYSIGISVSNDLEMTWTELAIAQFHGVYWDLAVRAKLSHKNPETE